MTTPDKQVKIKLTGELKPIKACIKKLEQIYPFNVQTEIKENDQDNGYHVFITVPESAEA